MHIGQTGEALRLVREVVERDPYPPAWLHYAEGKCLFFAGRHEEAITALEKAGPGLFRVHAMLAASYAALNRLEEARREVGLMLAERPGLTFNHFQAVLPFADPAALDPFFNALRKAGFDGGE